MIFDQQTAHFSFSSQSQMTACLSLSHIFSLEPLTLVGISCERNRESLGFSLKATRDLIKYVAEVMDDFISERQHPSEIQARPGLQMAS